MDDINVGQLQRLLTALDQEGFQSLDLSFPQQGIRVKVVVPQRARDLPSDRPGPATHVPSTESGSASVAENLFVKVLSERVGIFSGGKTPIAPGSKIARNAPLGAIKGISFQDTVRSPVDGKLAEIHVRDGEIVEFGKLLFTIERLPG